MINKAYRLVERRAASCASARTKVRRRTVILLKSLKETDGATNCLLFIYRAFCKDFRRFTFRYVAVVVYACICYPCIFQAALGAAKNEAPKSQILRMNFDVIGLDNLPRLLTTLPPMNAVPVFKQELPQSALGRVQPLSVADKPNDKSTDNCPRESGENIGDDVHDTWLHLLVVLEVFGGATIEASSRELDDLDVLSSLVVDRDDPSWWNRFVTSEIRQ